MTLSGNSDGGGEVLVVVHGDVDLPQTYLGRDGTLQGFGVWLAGEGKERRKSVHDADGLNFQRGCVRVWQDSGRHDVHCVTVNDHDTSPRGTGLASGRVFIACLVIAGWRVVIMVNSRLLSREPLDVRADLRFSLSKMHDGGHGTFFFIYILLRISFL